MARTRWIQLALTLLIVTASGLRLSAQDCNLNGIPDANETAPFTGGRLFFGPVPSEAQSLTLSNIGSIVPTSGVTIEFWQAGFIAQVAAAVVSQPYVATNSIGINTPWIDGRVYFDYGDGLGSGRVFTPVLPNSSGWNHWAFTSGPMFGRRIYRNGVLLASAPGFGTYSPAGATLNLFGGGANTMSGGLADFRFYGAERSQAQIQSDMQSQVLVNEPSLLFAYRFSSPTGPTVADASGNGHTGTVAGTFNWIAQYAAQSGTLHACIAPTVSGQLVATPCLADVGQTVSVTPPTVTTVGAGWIPTYQWIRDGVPVGGPSTIPPTSFAVTALDYRAQLSLRVGHQWVDNPAAFASPAAVTVPFTITVVPPDSPEAVNPGTGHRYRRLGFACDLQTARSAAYDLGGRLVVINDAAEQVFINSNFSASPAFRIGYSDELLEGAFRWDNGALPNYVNWSAGEPNNAGDSDSTVFTPSAVGTWSDEPSSAAFDALVEFDSQRQTNKDSASLVIEGIDGPPWPIPVVLNSASYGLNPSVTVAISGVCNAPFTLSLSPDTAPTGLSLPPIGILDLDLGTLAPLFDGIGIFGPPNPFASTNSLGQWTFEVPFTGVPSGFLGALQAIVFDPTNPMVPFSFTAASRVSVVNQPGSAIYVSSSTGLPGNPGTATAPLNSIQSALNLSFNTQSKPPVYISAGVYAETLTFRDGVSVRGGCDPSTWIPGSAGLSVINCAASGCLASLILQPTTISHLRIQSADALDGQVPPANSIALVITQCWSSLSFVSCEFRAGDGGDGSPGAAGTAGANGNSGGNAGGLPYPIFNFGYGGSGTLTQQGGNGGFGGLLANGSTGGLPGFGAPVGGPGGLHRGCCNSLNIPLAIGGAHGYHGSPGLLGPHGSGGTGGSFSFTPMGTSFVIAGDGNVGFPGDFGRGGSGGGGGGGDLEAASICLVGLAGGGGGGGGGGGFPGIAGGFGRGGGASAGVVISNASTAIGFTNCVFRSGSGGAGGTGGAGGAGGAGGLGGLGHGGATGTCAQGGTGGNGGPGGPGGFGGGGGGGAGGPSICIVVLDTSTLSVVTPEYFPGPGGAGGAGGLGANGTLTGFTAGVAGATGPALIVYP